MKLFAIYLTLALSLAFISCQDNTVEFQNNSSRNVPVTTNILNNFTFTVSANSNSLHQDFPVNFNTDSLAVAISVGEYKSESGQINVIDSRDSTIYSKAIDSGLVTAEVLNNGMVPKTVSINFSRLTCNISFVVSAM